LRETIQELEAFSYSVSHDMRSPLRAMQGYADAVLEDCRGKLDATAEEYLQRIRRAAGRMDLLIQDVLAYSRVAKGEIRLHKVDVEHVIRDVIQNYPALQLAHADISIVTPIPPILGHEAYLTQIISNFLGNAVKFVERGSRPEVKISAQSEGEMVRISFQDKGIGIAREHQNQIFQIFGRVYPEKKYEGTGIGLAIAKKAAERMGGSVGVLSELGRGSEFFVLLRRT
jgi:signal transduction histidine kinase